MTQLDAYLRRKRNCQMNSRTFDPTKGLEKNRECGLHAIKKHDI